MTLSGRSVAKRKVRFLGQIGRQCTTVFIERLHSNERLRRSVMPDPPNSCDPNDRSGVDFRLHGAFGYA
jgi:hypothetical protein